MGHVVRECSPCPRVLTRLLIPKAFMTLSNSSAPAPRAGKTPAKNVIEQAGQYLRQLRVAEVVAKDMVLRDGKVEHYRTKVKVSFKYEGHG